MDVVPEKKSNDEVGNQFTSVQPDNNQFQIARERFLLITHSCTSRNSLGIGLRRRILNWDVSKGLRHREDEALGRLFIAYHDTEDDELVSRSFSAHSFSLPIVIYVVQDTVVLGPS